MLIMDGEDQVVRANRALYSTFGLASEQIVGRSLRELPGALAKLGRLPREATDQTVHLSVPGESNRPFRLSWRKLAETDSPGQVILTFQDTQGDEKLWAGEAT